MSNPIKLGKNDIHRMGYGAMRLPGMRGVLENEELARSLLISAVEQGVNVIDTADYYGNGLANRLIADALHPYSESLYISTKVGAKSGENGPPIPAATTEEINLSVNRNLESLKTDVLDLVFLRLSGGPLADSGVPIQESVLALENLRKQGVIKHIGLSSVTAEQFDIAKSITNIDAVQNAYFVGHTSSKAVLDKCNSNNIPFFAYFPLGMGKLSENEAVRNIAVKYNITTSKVALAWLLQLSPVMVPIPGTSSLKHLSENITAAELNLEPEDVAILSK